MMKKLFFGVIVFSVVLAACEKVIDIPLNEAERQTVIEGVITDRMGDNYILITRSASVYTNTDYPVISDAEVVVEDNKGNVFVFEEVDSVPGRYNCPDLISEPETRYDLTISAEDEVFTATTFAPKSGSIDSLSTEVQDFGLSEFLGYVPYTVYVHLTDDPAVENFYRFKIAIDNDFSDIVYIGNDDLVNGESFSAPFLGDLARLGDSVEVIMLAIDEAYYEFQISLPSAQGGSGGFAVAPGNPVTNIQGPNTVGYFAAFQTDTIVYVVTE